MGNFWHDKWEIFCMTNHQRPRRKKCRQCKEAFVPDRIGQKVCSPGCAIAAAQATRDRDRKRQQKADRERVKTPGQLKGEAQTAFNAYIRARDAHRGCISCGTMTAGQYHAGHYRTRKAAPQIALGTWLSCLNVNKQCAQCNLFDSGNIAGQRRGLVERYGAGIVERLEGSHETVKRNADWYRRCRDIYRRRTRHITRLRERMRANRGAVTDY